MATSLEFIILILNLTCVCVCQPRDPKQRAVRFWELSDDHDYGLAVITITIIHYIRHYYFRVARIVTHMRSRRTYYTAGDVQQVRRLAVGEVTERRML